MRRAMTIATAATLGTFTLEYFLHKEFHKRLIDKPGVHAKTQRALDTEQALETDHPVAKDADAEDQAGPRCARPAWARLRSGTTTRCSQRTYLPRVPEPFPATASRG